MQFHFWIIIKYTHKRGRASVSRALCLIHFIHEAANLFRMGFFLIFRCDAPNLIRNGNAIKFLLLSGILFGYYIIFIA